MMLCHWGRPYSHNLMYGARLSVRRTEVLPVRKDFAAAENSFRFGNTQDQEANVPAGNIAAL